MDPILRKSIEEGKGRNIVNDDIVSGLGGKALDSIIEVADYLLKGASAGNTSGVEYVGIERCSPEAQFNFVTQPQNNRISFDISENTFFLSKITFKYEGEELAPRYLWLPYSEPGSIIKIGGSAYTISPVISDKSLSPNNSSVFIRLLRVKIRVSRKVHSFIENGKKEIAGEVLYSHIFVGAKAPNGVNIVTKASPTVMHYLLCRYGFSEAMNKLTGTVPQVGTVKEIASKYGNDENWVTFESRKIRPAKTFIGPVYTPTQIAIAIPKNHYNKLAKNSIASLFYILDHFTDIDISDLDNTDMWVIKLGYLYFGEQAISDIQESMVPHMASISNYVDCFTVVKLQKEFEDTLGQDFSEDGFWKLLLVVMERFDRWVVASDQIAATAFDKRMEVLYYLMFTLTISANNLFRELNALKLKHISAKAVMDKIKRILTPGIIFDIRSKNVACNNIHYIGDHKYFKGTSAATIQSNTKGVDRASSKGTHVPDPTTLLDASHMIVGTIAGVSKNNLSPLSYLNLFAEYDSVTNSVLPSEQILRETAPLRKILSSMSGNSSRSALPEEFDIYGTSRRIDDK